jgi:signal transduction histidine kinase
MGLLVSLNIVQKHGGRIDVDSQVGEGSTFTIVLPHARAKRSA